MLSLSVKTALTNLFVVVPSSDSDLQSSIFNQSFSFHFHPGCVSNKQLEMRYLAERRREVSKLPQTPRVPSCEVVIVAENEKSVNGKTLWVGGTPCQ